MTVVRSLCDGNIRGFRVDAPEQWTFENRRSTTATQRANCLPLISSLLVLLPTSTRTAVPMSAVQIIGTRRSLSAGLSGVLGKVRVPDLN